MALGPLARDSTYCRTPHRTDDSGAAAASARKPSCNPCSAGGRHHQPSARRRSPSEVCASATRQALGAAAHCPGHGRVCKCHGPCWTMITAVRTSTSGTSTHKPQWTVRWTMSVDGRIGSEFSGQREPAPPPTGRAHHLGGRLVRVWPACTTHTTGQMRDLRNSEVRSATVAARTMARCLERTQANEVCGTPGAAPGPLWSMRMQS